MFEGNFIGFETTLEKKISELEKENERLREALRQIAKNKWEYEDGIIVTGSEHTLMQVARDALAERVGEI